MVDRSAGMGIAFAFGVRGEEEEEEEEFGEVEMRVLS